MNNYYLNVFAYAISMPIFLVCCENALFKDVLLCFMCGSDSRATHTLAAILLIPGTDGRQHRQA